MIAGRFWGTDCNDTNGGCGFHDHRPLGAPDHEIGLWIAPADGSRAPRKLGTIDADRNYEFNFRFELEPSIAPGRYVVEAISHNYRTSAAMRITPGLSP